VNFGSVTPDITQLISVAFYLYRAKISLFVFIRLISIPKPMFCMAIIVVIVVQGGLKNGLF